MPMWKVDAFARFKTFFFIKIDIFRSHICITH